jgi:hypothetical protein
MSGRIKSETKKEINLLIFHTVVKSRDSLVGIATRIRAGRSGF